MVIFVNSIAEDLVSELEQARQSLTKLSTEYELAKRTKDHPSLAMELMMLNKDFEMAMRSARKIQFVISEVV